MWEISSSIFPNRICTKCRLTLTKNPLNFQFPMKLYSPSRLHTSATTWVAGDCSLCDIAFQKGRKPKKRNSIGKKMEDTNANTFVMICKNCGVESAKIGSIEHICTVKDAKNNIINLIENSKASSLAIATRLIRNVCKSGESVILPTEGHPIKVHVGNQPKPIVSLTAEDILKQQADMRWSSRQSANNIKTIRIHLQNQNIKAKLSGKNAVQKLIKDRTEELFDEKLVRGNKGSELNPIICDVNVVYCTNIIALARNIFQYRGDFSRLVKIQGDHGQGSFKLSAQFTFSNSVNDLQILAVTSESGESILTIKSIIELVKPQSLEDMGIMIYYTGDLKFIQLLLGIKTGNASYPCPWCNWRMTGKLRDPVEAYCTKRNIAKDVENFQKLGNDRSKSHLCHGQQSSPVINFEPSEQIVPPVLHIKLGLINAKCTSLESIYGSEFIAKELYSKARVAKKQYQGGTLEGNECNRVVKAYVETSWLENHSLFPYKPLFEAYDRMSFLAFTLRTSLTDDVKDISLAITEYIMTWQNMAPKLKLTEPLKLHILVHVLEFCAKFKCTPAAYGEQDGESLHRCFKKVLDQAKTQEKKSIQVAVKKFNASNF